MENMMKSDDHECRVSVFGTKHFTLMHLVLKIKIRLLEFVPCITRSDMMACMQTCDVKFNTSVKGSMLASLRHAKTIISSAIMHPQLLRRIYICLFADASHIDPVKEVSVASCSTSFASVLQPASNSSAVTGTQSGASHNRSTY